LSSKRGKIPREIFLSHSSKDRRFALRLAQVLQDHGLPLWYSPTEIVGAQQWIGEIGAALERCDWFVLVLSPNAIRSEWVAAELGYALCEKRYENRIVPVLYRQCKLQGGFWPLARVQCVDLREGFTEGWRELLAVWGKGYRGS